jgi:hypothetical protein
MRKANARCKTESGESVLVVGSREPATSVVYKICPPMSKMRQFYGFGSISICTLVEYWTTTERCVQDEMAATMNGVIQAVNPES